jgi:hypothetical protein
MSDRFESPASRPKQSPPEGRKTVVATFLVALAVVVLLLSPSGSEAQLNKTLHQDGWILAAARAPGLHGSIWRTDLWINLRSLPPNAEVTLYFCPSGEDNTDAPGITVPLDFAGGRYVYYFEDVLQELLGVSSGSWVGSIHYTSNTPIQVWARVYSISADGSESYGQLIEGIPTVDMSPDNDPWDSWDHQWIFAAKHTADDRYRVNVGVVNPTAVEGDFSVQIYDGTGDHPTGTTLLGLRVPPFSMVQLSDPFADVADGDWNSMIIRVVCSTEGCGSFGYASVVDNATNDAFFVRGVKMRRVDE